MRSVIVHGPQGCGKTTNAEAIREALGLSAVVDDWKRGQPFPVDGALILTNDDGIFHTVHRQVFRVLSFDDAMAETGVTA